MDDERERLRRNLYRPGAGARDVAAYESEIPVEVDDELDEPASASGQVKRPPMVRVVIVAALFVLAIVVGLVLLQRPLAGHVPRAVYPVDSGPRAHARGDAARVAAGIFAYTTASGDTADGIARRFSTCRAAVVAGLPLGDPEGPIFPDLRMTLRRATC